MASYPVTSALSREHEASKIRRSGLDAIIAPVYAAHSWATLTFLFLCLASGLCILVAWFFTGSSERAAVASQPRSVADFAPVRATAKEAITAAPTDVAALDAEIGTLKVRAVADVGLAGPMVVSAVAPDKLVVSPPAADTPSAGKTTSGRGDSAAKPAELEVAAVRDGAGTAAPPARPVEDERTALLVKRAEDFVATGDFASARLLLRRAAESGHAGAALRLAATYDPDVLDRVGAKAMADIGEAKLWYEKARELGSPEARRRLDLLAGH